MDSHIITLLLWYSAWLGHAFGHYTTHPNHYQSHHHHHNQPDWLPTDQNTRNYPATGPNGFVEFYRWTQMTYAALDSSKFILCVSAIASHLWFSTLLRYDVSVCQCKFVGRLVASRNSKRLCAVQQFADGCDAPRRPIVHHIAP